MGTLPTTKWRFLRHLSLTDNAMTSIPSTSLASLANTLFSLDLSSNLFSQVPDSLATLTALRALNLAHCMIDSLNSLTRNPLPAITALNLRANRLQCLAGIEKLFPLERLDLRDNKLVDVLELARLTGIPDIREIWIEGNPFTRTHKDYRVAIFNMFRATPGYTVDIVIDGSGPSYSEKRLLVERAPIPNSVPVVKSKAPEMPPVVDISKSAFIHGNAKDGTFVRKEKPVPNNTTSEDSLSLARRRKSTKRRIVDLANGQADVYNEAPPSLECKVDEAMDCNYRVSRPSDAIIVHPVIPPSIIQMDKPKLEAQIIESTPPTPFDGIAALSVGAPQNWDVSGEVYRRKIEALRDRVGNGYLSVLSEEAWDGSGCYNATNVPPVPALRAGHMSHHVPPAAAVHSGRTLG